MSALFRRARRGANAVELALTMPVFVAVLGGVFDYTWYLYRQSALDSSTHLGCRVGSTIDPGEADAQLGVVETEATDAVVSAMSSAGIPCDGDCVVQIETFGVTPGRSLRCITQQDFTPLVGIALGARQITARSAVRFEFQR